MVYNSIYAPAGLYAAYPAAGAIMFSPCPARYLSVLLSVPCQHRSPAGWP